MDKGYKSVPHLIDYIHFNKNKPENHNVMTTNMRDNKISIYDGEKYVLVEKQDILEQLKFINKINLINKSELFLIFIYK